MTLDAAILLFSRLGVQVATITKQDFSAAYYGLAKRYHPDCGGPRTAELMANINAARACVLKNYRWPTATARATEQRRQRQFV